MSGLVRAVQIIAIQVHGNHQRFAIGIVLGEIDQEIIDFTQPLFLVPFRAFIIIKHIKTADHPIDNGQIYGRVGQGNFHDPAIELNISLDHPEIERVPGAVSGQADEGH